MSVCLVLYVFVFSLLYSPVKSVHVCVHVLPLSRADRPVQYGRALYRTIIFWTGVRVCLCKRVFPGGGTIREAPTRFRHVVITSVKTEKTKDGGGGEYKEEERKGERVSTAMQYNVERLVKLSK